MVLLQFLRDINMIADAEARAEVPDCEAITDLLDHLNCTRARAGWTSDIVALAEPTATPAGSNPTTRWRRGCSRSPHDANIPTPCGSSRSCTGKGPAWLVIWKKRCRSCARR